MGYWISNYSEVVVTDVIGPGPNAVHERAKYVPDHDFQEGEIQKIYYQSGRLKTYLGDWHSHPEGSSYLSSVDKRTLKRIADYPEARASKALMIIVAISSRTKYFKVWMYDSKTSRWRRIFQEFSLKIYEGG